MGRILHFALVAMLVALWGHQFLEFLARYERFLVGLGVFTLIGIGVACSLR